MSCVRIPDLISMNAIERSRKRNVFVCERSLNTVCKVRIRITKNHLVVIVNDTVAVSIDKFQLARCQRTDRFLNVGQLRIAFLNDSVGLIAVE